MVKSVELDPKISSDAIHNRNCYDYFLQLKECINQELIDLIPQFGQLNELLHSDYNENFPYGDLYTLIIRRLELIVDDIQHTSSEKIAALDNLILAIYHNNNHILEQAHWINDITANARPQRGDSSKIIGKKLQDPRQTINHRSPKDSGSLPRAIYSVFADNFKPQTGTNIPSIKNSSYKNNSDAIEYRFSTQAQRHKGLVRINPLFKRWLKIKADMCPPQHKISHIYFNNLAFDRSALNIAGSKEREFTIALHQLEQNPELKVIVITLPADEGLMKSSDYRVTDNLLAYNVVFTELLDVAKGYPHKSGISDFIISNKARTLLFGPKAVEHQILESLLKKSFKKQGINPGIYLSTAERQAVWVHFIKYELTGYILNKAKPQSYNFSCKDAIDRGALSSTYYNLLKSFESESPMQRAEFERSLDTAAANVKGRGMNFHRKIIWNALNSYITANYLELITNPQKSWLIYWRDMNCPHSRVEQLLKIRLIQSKELFESLPDDKGVIKATGLHLLNSVREHYEQKVSGKRLLLEAVSRTSELLTDPSPESLQKYKQLADEMKIKNPKLLIIGGLLEAFAGLLLYLPTLGYTQKLIKHGFATANSGFFAAQRAKLSNEIIEFASAQEELLELTAFT